MKLIFDLENKEKAQEEFKNVLGFIDAQFEVNALKIELYDATTELIKIIGKDTYDYIATLYADDIADEKEKFLILKTQSVLAHDAYRKFAPKSDLAVSNQGRVMRMDEHHKSPFPWMIAAHNESLERTYYKQLDYLIELLDEQNPTVKDSKKWKDTDHYKNSFSVLFRTADEFGEFFNISSRYLLMKLSPGIKLALENDIKPVVGDDELKVYLDELAKDEVSDKRVMHEIKAAAAYSALSWAIKRMSATLFPEGVLQSYLANSLDEKQPPDKNEVGVLAHVFEQDAKRALMRLERLFVEELEGEEFDPFEINIHQKDKFIDT